MTKSSKRKFIQFLKENDALIPFCVNLAISPWTRKHKRPSHEYNWGNKSLSKHLTLKRPSDYINYAFQWEGTPEGKQYWANLDYKWVWNKTI